MSDGAHQGIDAKRALATILGGKEPPGPQDGLTRDGVLRRVLAAPLPPDPRPTDYGVASDSIARGFLEVVHDMHAVLTMNQMWDGLKAKYPGFDDWLGGASGFMVGWAYNCVRFLSFAPPAPNPAIVTIEAPEKEPER
jgi:hypothetical protein